VAKTRAQRKAEQRRRAQQQAQRPEGTVEPTETDAQAQHQTQVPESADAIEAELAERGADLDALRGAEPEAPAPSRADVGRPEEAEADDKISRRARKREEREAKARAKESEQRRAPKEPRVAQERQRGGVMGFFASCVAELRRVQWPDRETLIQATAITIVFIAAMSAYLGVLDAVFNWLVQQIL
jgi:preprotein translocase SecE subunit